MSAPTQNDKIYFKQISIEEKAAILYKYLCSGRTSMQAVASEYYNSAEKNNVMRISCITRCYDFGDRNGGKLTDIGATYDEVYKFVCKYPDGVPYVSEKGMVMRQYLTDLVAKRKRQQTTQNTVKKDTSIRQVKRNTTSKVNNVQYLNNQNSRGIQNNGSLKIIVLAGVIIVGIIVLLNFLDSKVFKHDISVPVIMLIINGFLFLALRSIVTDYHFVFEVKGGIGNKLKVNVRGFILLFIDLILSGLGFFLIGDGSIPSFFVVILVFVPTALTVCSLVWWFIYRFGTKELPKVEKGVRLYLGPLGSILFSMLISFCGGCFFKKGQFIALGVLIVTFCLVMYDRREY
jgi:hypothetical protein